MRDDSEEDGDSGGGDDRESDKAEDTWINVQVMDIDEGPLDLLEEVTLLA